MKGYSFEARAMDRGTKRYLARITGAADVAASGYTVVAGMRGLTATRSAEGILRITLPNTHTRLLYANAIGNLEALTTTFEAEDVASGKTVDFRFAAADTAFAATDPDSSVIFVEIVVQDGTRA